MPAAAIPMAAHESGWLTMNEAAARLRFGSGRTLAAYLRRMGLSVPVYRRIGVARPLFMRVEDVDKVFQVVPLRPTPAEVDAGEPPRESSKFERVTGPRAVAPRRRGRK